MEVIFAQELDFKEIQKETLERKKEFQDRDLKLHKCFSTSLICVCAGKVDSKKKKKLGCRLWICWYLRQASNICLRDFMEVLFAQELDFREVQKET